MTQERPSAPAKQRVQIPRICASSLISDLAGQVTCTHPKQSAAEEGVCSDSLTSGLQPLSANAALDPTVISFASSSLISWPSEADHGEHGSHTPVNKELRNRPAHPITFAVPAYSTTGNMAHTINQGAFSNWLIEFNPPIPPPGTWHTPSTRERSPIGSSRSIVSGTTLFPRQL